MIIRLGYACLCKTLEGVTSSTNLTYTEYLKNKDMEKLDKIILSNLEDLEKIIDYNERNNIHFYRLSSKIIPLATKEDVSFDYLKRYHNSYERIAKKITNMRIDFHPDQFCVLNSTKKEVVDNSLTILNYHYQLLGALNIQNKLILLHIGSSIFGKENSIKRFIYNFKKLPLSIQQSIAIENDDKVYNVEDCIKISTMLKIPFVLDYHHHLCNHEQIDCDFETIFRTFKTNPKIHFSSPKNKTKKEMRSHHDYIDVFTFISFIEQIKHLPYDIDIMLEAKAKDEALFRLVRQLKYYTDYHFIDDTTFRV